MKKILAILLALTFVVCAFAACGSKPEETTTAPAEVTSEEVPAVDDTTAAPVEGTSAEATEAVTDESTTAAEGETTTLADGETTTAAEKKLPTTPAEILAAYTAVMNQAKKDAPGFTKIEYQVLPDDANSRVITKGETLVSLALNVAGNFMTTEDKAKSEPEVKEKGNNMHNWPVYKCDAGCMLTDVSFIKSAKCEQLSNGNYKITMVTKSENNPEPPAEGAASSPSKTGAMFGTISRKEIDDTLKGGIVSAAFKDVTYNLVFHDCTVVLVYNPANNQVISLDQTTHTTISGSAKALGISLDITKQELIDYVKFYDIKY